MAPRPHSIGTQSFALEIDRLAEAVDTEPLLGLVASESDHIVLSINQASRNGDVRALFMSEAA